MSLNVYVGWDSREDIAYQACRDSILENTQANVNVIPLKTFELEEQKVYYRTLCYPDEKAATEFAFTRFLVPHLNRYQGKAVFVDCDFIFRTDIQKLFDTVMTDLDVCVVKHDYVPKFAIKMDGQRQVVYPRKNWSSLMLFNCASKVCKTLTPQGVSKHTGAFLHRFNWCVDERIGGLPIWWNWLEGEYNLKDQEGIMPRDVWRNGPYAVHYTNGGPWFPELCKERKIEFWEDYMAYACSYMSDTEIAYITREQTRFEKPSCKLQYA